MVIQPQGKGVPDSKTKDDKRHVAIQLAAYLKAEQAGFPLGQDRVFWLEAEKKYDAAVAAGEWNPKAEPSSGPPDPPHYVVRVHGTFAYAESDIGQASWQNQSAFCNALADALGQGYVVNADPSNPKCPNVVFHWSGLNSETARRQSAAALLEYFHALEEQGHRYHVIAHSHGGSVLWETLCLAATAQKAEGTAKPLPGLKSWITVGTPFFHFIPQLNRLWAFVPLLLTLAVIWWPFWQWHWFWDLWNTRAETYALPGWAAFFAFLLGYPFAVILIALFVNAIYRTHKSSEAQEIEEDFPDRRRIETRRRNQAWLSLAMLLLVFGAIWLILPWLGHFLGIHPPTLRWFGWFGGLQYRLLLSVVFALAALIVVIVCAIPVVTTFYQMYACLSRAKRTREAWAQFHDRYACIAHHQADEAIGGLRQTQGGIAGPLLPRMLVPGEDEFSPHGRATRPETERNESRLNIMLHIFLLPVRLIYQWIGRYLYNDVFATLLDEFFLNKATAGADGADIWGAKLGLVSTTPIPREEEISDPRKTYFTRDRVIYRYTAARYLLDPDIEKDPAELKKQVTRCLIGPTSEVCESIARSTRTRAGDFLEQIRTTLGVPKKVQVKLFEFLKQALAGGLWAELLIHTSYFNSQEVLKLIAEVIAGAAVGRRTSPVDAGKPQRGKPPVEATPWPPPGLLANVLRHIVKFGLLCTPPLMLWLLGWLILYPASRDFFVDWASDQQLAALAVITEDELKSIGAAEQTPLVARWWVARSALGDGEDWWQTLQRRGLWVARRRFFSGHHRLEDFAALLESDTMRVLFYSKVGQKYAELDDEHCAVEAFTLARKLIDTMSSDNSSAKGYYAVALLMAGAYCNKAPRDLDALARSPAAQSIVLTPQDWTNANQYVQWQVARLKMYWKVKQSVPNERLREIISWSRRADNPGERMRRLAFFLAEDMDLGLDKNQLDLLCNEFAAQIDVWMHDVPNDAETRLSNGLYQVLAVLRDVGWRNDLWKKADQIRARLSARGFALGANLPYLISLRGIRGHFEVTALLEQALSDSGNTQKLPDVAGVFARWGRFPAAKEIADRPASKAKLGTSLQVLANELERRTSGPTRLTRSLDEEFSLVGNLGPSM